MGNHTELGNQSDIGDSKLLPSIKSIMIYTIFNKFKLKL